MTERAVKAERKERERQTERHKKNRAHRNSRASYTKKPGGKGTESLHGSTLAWQRGCNRRRISRSNRSRAGSPVLAHEAAHPKVGLIFIVLIHIVKPWPITITTTATSILVSLTLPFSVGLGANRAIRGAAGGATGGAAGGSAVAGSRPPALRIGGFTVRRSRHV